MNFLHFKQAYIECALWCSTDESDDNGDNPLDRNYDVGDLSPSAMDIINQDCHNFLSYAEQELEESGVSSDQAGHDFWLTRNHHGAGFWDRGLGKVGEELTKKAQSFGETYLYVGDDGKIYCE